MKSLTEYIYGAHNIRTNDYLFEDFCLDTVCDKGFGLYCKLEDCPQNYFNCVMEYYKLKAKNQID